MAIKNYDVTVTSTWTKISTSDTGDFVFYNEAQPTEHTPALGSPASEAIRWAFNTTTPTARGNVCYPGTAFSRGSVVGDIYVKVDSPNTATTIPAQKAE